MRTMSLLAFLPEEALPLMLVFAGLAFVLQQRKIAIALLTMAGVMIFLPPLIEPFLAMLPLWALYLLMGLFVLSIPFTVVSLIFGRRYARRFNRGIGRRVERGVFTGIIFLLSLPFRLIGRLFRRRWVQ